MCLWDKGRELTDEGIVQQKTCLPQGWTRLTITGVGKEEKTYEVKR